MIEIKEVTKKYGNFTAVDNISFEVKDGEILGLLGPNGAGKSTTMNMMTGFIEPTDGSIIINGYDISKKPKKAKKEIGYMPENVPSYQELTAKEFIKYMAELKLVNKKDRKEEVDRVIEKTGLTDVQNKLIKNLSRGYKQRVSMAGALVGNPSVIILDEPTVGLDPQQILDIRNTIKDLGKEHTVILSSHILSEVSQICDRVVIINQGKLVAIDTPENLEEKTKNKNIIYVTVEDPDNKMDSIKDKIEDIEELILDKENEDGSKLYKVVSAEEVDLRKKLFEALPKEDIVILELKKEETSLEDAFVKLVSNDNEEKEEANEERRDRRDRRERRDRRDRRQESKEEEKREEDNEQKDEEENKSDETEDSKEEIESKDDNKSDEDSKENETVENETVENEESTKTDETDETEEVSEDVSEEVPDEVSDEKEEEGNE